MKLIKNKANQILPFQLYNQSTGQPVTGDAANISVTISKDFQAAAASYYTTITEVDATNAPGWYTLQLSQAETNADNLLFVITSTTENAVAQPIIVATTNEAVNAIYNETGTINVNGNVANAGDSYPTATEIATAVWTAETTGITTAGQAGYRLNSAAAAGDPWSADLSSYPEGTAGDLLTSNLDAAISSRSTVTAQTVASAVWSQENRTLQNDPNLTAIRATTETLPTTTALTTALQTNVNAILADKIPDIADAVWDEPQAEHISAATTGATISSIASPWTATNLDQLQPGTAGYILAQRLDVPVSSRAAYSPQTIAEAVWNSPNLSLLNDETLQAIKDNTDRIPQSPTDSTQLQPAAEAALIKFKLHQLANSPMSEPAPDSLFDHLFENNDGWKYKPGALGAIDIGNINPSTIADAVWDAHITAHNNLGSAGRLMQEIDKYPEPETIARAVWEADPEYGNIPMSMGWHAMEYTPTSVANAVWNALAANHRQNGTFGSLIDAPISGRLPNTAGAGSKAFTYTITSQTDNSPIPGVTVTVYQNRDGTNKLLTASTDDDGIVIFYLNPGTYYIYRRKPGWSFQDPDEINVP